MAHKDPSPERAAKRATNNKKAVAEIVTEMGRRKRASQKTPETVEKAEEAKKANVAVVAKTTQRIASNTGCRFLSSLLPFGFPKDFQVGAGQGQGRRTSPVAILTTVEARERKVSFGSEAIQRGDHAGGIRESDVSALGPAQAVCGQGMGHHRFRWAI